MADHFNAIEYAHQLESAGVPAAQAEVHASALAQVLDSCLSAAMDSKSLKSELSYKISEVVMNLRAEIRQVETTLRTEIKESETKLRGEIQEFKKDLTERIDRLENRMNWMFGILVATQLTLFAMVAGLYLR